MSRLWNKGRDTDQGVLAFCVGDDHVLDERLVAYDVRASIAHAAMLFEQGLLSSDDCEQITVGLSRIAAEHEEGLWHIAVEEEDVHTALENRLTDLIGEAGGRVHLGRSRNDQVLAALRLYLKDVVSAVEESGADVARGLEEMAARQGDLAMPGYTHMQRAMPSTVGDWALAFAAEIRDDVAGVRRTLHRIDKNPLGSAAGYGTPGLDLDRARTSELLGFAEVQEPVASVQLSRGKAEAALVFELALLLQDVGRLAAELCLFNAAEFGFVQLPEAFTTGSSIMPQKRNPDVFELVRGRSAQATADLLAIMNVTAKMTSGYHRDLQLVKGPLFRAIDSAMGCLEIIGQTLSGITFNEAALESAMSDELHAAARAFSLVRDEKIPFREAYRRIAEDYA